MGKIKFNVLMNNDVLLGLIGKTCKCQEHQHPLHHFNIKNEDDVDIDLKINGIEVPGAAGFLQAYFRQSEKLVSDRVRRFTCEGFKESRNLISEITERVNEMIWSNENEMHSSDLLLNKLHSSDLLLNKLKELEMFVLKKIDEVLGNSNNIDKNSST